MACCSQCRGIEEEFGDRTARRELKRYRRRGPPRSTRMLLDAIRREASEMRVHETEGLGSLLDVGGGIGAIHHELLDEGLREAVHVDASTAYLAVARAEAERRGHEGRVRFLHGDFVELAGPALDAADIVTLDRVVCCYPDMEALVGASAAKSRRLYGLVYPRRTWWTRLGIPLANLWFRLRRSSFRAFLHDPAAVRAALHRRGFAARSRSTTVFWSVEVFARVE